MKKQLRIKYKDGGMVKVTNSKCINNQVFSNYLKQVAVSSIQDATLYTYPLKSNNPLVLVENGVPNNANVYEMSHS